MSERGVFALDRGWFDHPSFAREPFTEREAWAWLIAEAAFKERTKRIGSVVVKLDRGQVAASLRFMADKWDWSEPKVRRFLKRLKTDAMLTGETTHGITVLTICNYAKYQRVSLPRDAANDAQTDAGATQERRKVEDTKSIESDADAAPRASASLISQEAVDLADELAEIAGHKREFVPPGWCGAAMRVQSWLSNGWPREIIIAAVRGAAARKRGPPANSVQFFENAVAEEVARQAAPLPKVEIQEAQTLQVINGAHQSKSGVVEAFRQLGEQVQSRGGGEGGANALLRLPAR